MIGLVQRPHITVKTSKMDESCNISKMGCRSYWTRAGALQFVCFVYLRGYEGILQRIELMFVLDV